ncbi:MAG: sigma-70 family RNA polymerase sigma factor [Pseudomonadota bacterium]
MSGLADNRQVAYAAVMEDGSDDSLMRRYAGGDAVAFDVLYERYKGPIYRYCLRHGPRATAEEAHQEIWLALIRGRDDYVPEGRFRSWLFTLAHHTVINRNKAEMKHPIADETTEVVAAETPHGRDVDPEWQQLQGYIRQLPVHQRDALMLQHEGGFSVNEIADHASPIAA